MHIATSPIHVHGMEAFDLKLFRETQSSKMSSREARKGHDVPYLDDIDPILVNMCALSRHLVCVNRLEDTPYWHSNRKADRDIFADNGFNQTMDADWKSKLSTDLECNVLAEEYSRKRDYTQVLVRG